MSSPGFETVKPTRDSAGTPLSGSDTAQDVAHVGGQARAHEVFGAAWRRISPRVQASAIGA